MHKRKYTKYTLWFVDCACHSFLSNLWAWSQSRCIKDIGRHIGKDQGTKQDVKGQKCLGIVAGLNRIAISWSCGF